MAQCFKPEPYRVVDNFSCSIHVHSINSVVSSVVVYGFFCIRFHICLGFRYQEIYSSTVC